MELEFDPLVDARLLDALHVAGPGTERQAIQSVDGAFLRVHRCRLTGGGLVFLPAECELGHETGCHKQRNCQQQTAFAERIVHPDWPHPQKGMNPECRKSYSPNWVGSAGSR